MSHSPTAAEATPEVAPDRSWVQDGACWTGKGNKADVDVFFMENGSPSERAKKICRRCDVAPLCYSYAVEAGIQYGVWGGEVFTRYGQGKEADA